MPEPETTSQPAKQVKIKLRDEAPALLRKGRDQMKPEEWKMYHALCALKAHARVRTATVIQGKKFLGYMIAPEAGVSVVPVLLTAEFVEVVENVQN